MHRRRAGRGHADRGGVIMYSKIMDVLGDRVLEFGPKPDAAGPYKNFKLTRDVDGIAWLLFDRDGSSANTLSAGVMEELDAVLAELEGHRPAGLVIRSAKPSGFIAGADVNEFSRRDRDERGRSRDRPRACGDRPVGCIARAERRRDPRLLPRRRARSRAGLPVAHRDRRRAFRLSRGDAWACIRAWAAPRASRAWSIRRRR